MVRFPFVPGEPRRYPTSPMFWRTMTRDTSTFIKTTADKAPQRKTNLLDRYYERCGFRSVLFQGILAGWTLLCGACAFLLCVVTFPEQKSELQRTLDALHKREGLDVAAWFFTSFLVPGAVWVLIALPLIICLLYTSPSPRDQRGSRMPSSA